MLAAGACLLFWHWMWRKVDVSELSGDTWYMRQFAYTDDPVSAPYCWRPLVPMLARVLGFVPLSYAANMATCAVIYFFVGGGWVGFACVLMFLGNRNMFPFNIKNPEYSESVGQLLFISSLWAMSTGSPLIWPLLLLAALCRETIAAALGLIALFVNPLFIFPLALGAAVSYLSRKENKQNRHPLVEETVYGTVKRWAKIKSWRSLHWAHIIQPLRGFAFAVPFVWNGVGDFTRLALVGFIPIWLLALPASGQSRIIGYGFGLLIPFIAVLPVEWVWFFVLISWFWPFEFSMYNESGGQTFGFAR